MNEDTVKLLRECDAGARMGIASLEDVLDRVEDTAVRDCLTRCKADHEDLDREIRRELDSYGEEGKAPNPIAQGMSWVKTNVKLEWDESDATVANLLTDGCNMGIKSLNRYLNQYENADHKAKALAKRLVSMEQKLTCDLRPYL